MSNEKLIEQLIGSGYKTVTGKSSKAYVKGKEGVEITFTGEIKPFLLTEDYQREYTVNISEELKNIIAGDSPKPMMKRDKPKEVIVPKVIEHGKMNQEGEMETVQIVQASGTTTAIIPDTFTPALVEKWKKISVYDRLLMVQNTQKEDIEQRKQGNQMISYVKGNRMMQEANFVFLWNWSSYIENISVSEKTVSVQGYIEVEIDGKKIRRSSIGIEEINSLVDAEKAKKSAVTDMIKKALSTLGFNGDVFRGEV